MGQREAVTCFLLVTRYAGTGKTGFGQYIQGSVIHVVSGTHWGPWNICPSNKGGMTIREMEDPEKE